MQIIAFRDGRIQIVDPSAEGTGVVSTTHLLFGQQVTFEVDGDVEVEVGPIAEPEDPA
jgi:hypothetical protein